MGVEAVDIGRENGAGEGRGGRERRERWRFLIYLLRPATSWIKKKLQG